MPLQPGTYIRAPFTVNAIRVTADNIEEVTVWCGGDLRTEQGDKKYIKIRASRPTKVDQTMAYPGDWVVRGSNGFKVFNSRSFWKVFRDKTDTYTEETRHKVFGVLVEAGLHGDQAREAIEKMRKMGILFRERVKVQEQSDSCNTYDAMGVTVHTDDNYGMVLAEEAEALQRGDVMLVQKLSQRNSS